MRNRFHPGLVVAAGVLAAFAVPVCGAQSKPSNDPAPCTVAPQPQPCGSTPSSSSDKGAAAQRFPFPGEGSNGEDSASPEAPAPSIGGAAAAPSPSTDTTKGTQPDAAKQFPFPGEGDGTSSSSSSSSSDSGDDAPIPGTGPGPNANTPPQLQDKGSEGQQTPGRHLLHRVNPLGMKLQTPDEREQEDISVAHFYMDSGDLKGAYLRSEDAVKTIPNDPDAHFTLAEVAAKLDKREEAIAEYNACLKLDPTDKEVKESRKAIKKLSK